MEEHKVAIWLKDDQNINDVLQKLFENPYNLHEMKIRAKLMAKQNSTRDICEILMK